MIRCVMADDHVLIREVLCKVMEQTSTIRIVGDHGDAREAAEHAVDQKVDVLILDVNIPGTDPFEAARWAKSSHFSLKVVFLTGSTEEEHVLNAIEAGASAYLVKTCGLEELQHTIARVHRGDLHLPILPSSIGHAHVQGFQRLSPRQTEVLKLLAEGNSVKEVSILLGLSAKTVEVHKSNLMERLGIHNKVQLVMYAVRHKVVAVTT
jgi:DNA-binding NarL/FixJ family response regulator